MIYNGSMIKLKRDNILITIDDNYNIAINDKKAQNVILPLIKIAKENAKMDYSVSDGFYSYFLADKIKQLGFKILSVSDPEENSKEELIY